MAIKKIREKKRKDQTRTQDVTKFGLKIPTSPDTQPSTIKVEPKH
jgi:hypothetical protein